MVKKNKSLAEYLYDNLQQNHYLRKLVKQLFTQYAYFLFQAKWALDKKEKTDLLKFADLLSKAQSNNGASECKNLALKIITMLQKMYPEDPNIDIVRNTVLSSLKNYLPRENHGYIKINTVDFLWDEVIDNYNKIQRKIPGQENQTFIGDQDKIFNSLENSINSFSAPTSMGKTYLMKKFIEYKVKTGEELNFAITVPSKALITEVRSSLLTDLVDNLSEHSYRIISRAEEYALDYENRNYIFVMTPERLSNLLLDNNYLRLDYLFIDESQKATEMDDRSIYYYEIIDKVQKWKQKPRITFASPLIPNPDVFLQLIDGSIKNNIRVDESPVTQTKFIIDRYNKELSVYNDQTKKKQHLCEFTENAIPHIVKMITDVMKGKTQSLIYYGSKRDVMSDAIVFSRQPLPTIESKELDELAAYISRKINPKYVLVDLVKKGIAFHIGELPIDVRTKIEEAYRKGILRTVFCTSTLLEGVNLPADNIFVTSLGNGKKKLSQLEFLNLIGRVGRIGHSMIGNVFLITGEKEKSHSNLSSYLKYLSKKLSKEHLSVEKALKPKQVAAIKKSLSAGDLKLSAVTDKRNYDLLRKISLIYIKELNHNQEGFTRKQFKKKISDSDEAEIFTALHSKYPDELQDDVNFSADQSSLLKQAITGEEVKEFPQIFNDQNKLNVEGTYQFFLKLAHIFNWNLYERKFIHADSDENIQHQTLEDYAKLVLMWISGYSLKQICDFVIEIRQRDFQFLDRLDQSRKLVGNINWDTIAINITMNQLNKLNFVLGKYFLKVSKELSANGIPLDNNWYQYLEYGTSSDLRIWLQQNGYSRESSQYIESNADDLIITGPGEPLISNKISQVNDPDVISETKEVRANVPGIFY